MHPAFASIVFGPFQTAYHSGAVDEQFREALSFYLEQDLLPQVDEPFESTEGSLVAAFNEEKYCGPNSLVKDAYVLDFSFVRNDGRDTIKIELVRDPKTGGFRPRYRGRGLELSTAKRRSEGEAFLRKIQLKVAEIIDGKEVSLVCPSCNGEMELVNNAHLFDLSCPNGCIAYNFHRDPTTGDAMHGHVYSRPRRGEPIAIES
jgi:hypothetical protein